MSTFYLLCSVYLMIATGHAYGWSDRVPSASALRVLFLAICWPYEFGYMLAMWSKQK